MAQSTEPVVPSEGVHLALVQSPVRWSVRSFIRSPSHSFILQESVGQLLGART